MRNIEDTISLFVKNQFPSFYEEQGPSFVEFVKQYYKYLEQTGNPLSYSRNLLEYRDIDKTIDSFIVHFKEKYLKYFPYELAVEDTRFLVKHIMDFYRSKGSERSYEIFFRSIYNATPTLYYPKQDLFKLSDGSWHRPVYLEVFKKSRNLKDYVGKTIIGSISQATAFVEAITTKRSRSKYISIVYLSGVQGNFIAGEIMMIESNPVIEGSPLIVGSLTSVDVITGGENFKVGDELKIVSGQGSGGVLRVSQIATETGVVKFRLVESGFGFTNTASVLVSHKTMDVLQTAPASNFKIFDAITQPLATIEYVSQTATSPGVRFNVGDVISGFYVDPGNPANNRLVGNGTIISITRDDVESTNGTITVATHSGNVANGSDRYIYNSSNTVKALIKLDGTYGNRLYTDITAVGNCVGSNATSFGVINVTPTKVFKSIDGNYVHGSHIRVEGDANVTYACTVITGNETKFTEDLAANDIIVIDTFKYQVNTVANDTLLTIKTPYAKNNATNVIIKKHGYISHVVDIGLGSGAEFRVGNLGSPESVRLDYTFLRDRNVSNVAFMDITLDALNSGTSTYTRSFNASSDVNSTDDTILMSTANKTFAVGAAVTYHVAPGNTAIGGLVAEQSYYISFANSSSIKLSETLNGPSIDLTAGTNETGHSLQVALSGYGFWKYPGGDKDALLLDCIDIGDFTIGTVESIISVNGGENYTKPPFVKIYEPKTGGYVNKKDWIFNTTSYTDGGRTYPSNFLVGELIYGTSLAPATVLSVSSYGGNTEAAIPGEFVYQSNGTANIAVGYIHLASINAGEGDLTLVDVTGSFVPLTYPIKTLSSNATATVNSFSLTNLSIEGRGVVKEGSNSSVVYAKRLTFFDSLQANSILFGRASDSAVRVTKVIPDQNTLNIGNNCVVTANVTVANGTIIKVDVVDSGIGYVEDEIVTALQEETSTAITVKNHAQSQGVGAGFYQSTGGFASHDKYLHDGDYYQNFSYDVKCNVPFDTYKDVLKQVIHIAGTKLFGTFVNEVTLDLTVTGSTERTEMEIT